MLLFVYNADSGKLNAMFDTAHKLLSPSTYECRLCQLTYGLANEKAAWKAFREASDEEMIFLHRDEYQKQYQQDLDMPFLARVEGKELTLLITAEEFSAISDTQSLIAKIKELSQI